MGSFLFLVKGLLVFFFSPGVAILLRTRSVTLTVVSMVLLCPGPSVHTFWIEYFWSFLGLRSIKYGGSGVTLKYFGCVGIKRDGAISISKLSVLMSVSMSEKSLVGVKAMESSARGWSPR